MGFREEGGRGNMDPRHGRHMIVVKRQARSGRRHLRAPRGQPGGSGRLEKAGSDRPDRVGSDVLGVAGQAAALLQAEVAHMHDHRQFRRGRLAPGFGHAAPLLARERGAFTRRAANEGAAHAVAGQEARLLGNGAQGERAIGAKRRCAARRSGR